MVRRVILILLLLPIPLSAARHRASLPVSFPACAVVEGTPAVTFSRDGGVTLAGVAQKLEGVGYTFGLAALDGRTLIAIHKQTLSISTDAGCRWSAVGSVAFDDPPRIAAAGANRAYIWGDGRAALARYAAGVVTMLKPPVTIVGIAASGDRVRVGGDDGSIWESVDGGGTWAQIGVRAFNSAGLVYRAAFDPASFDHVLFGAASVGARVTFDGGKSYATPAGLTAGTNVFNIVISPADPKVVWAMGINLAEADANVPSHGRHIYRSVDGGASFVPVVDEAPGVQLINGPVMAAHPTDPNVLYFVFGTYFDAYGTDLFRYDAAAKSLTVSHFNYDDFDAIVFSPADPSVMYFGLEVVQRTSP
jgi:photosystem II stability/assembly factor-like uncharacterized protein